MIKTIEGSVFPIFNDGNGGISRLEGDCFIAFPMGPGKFIVVSEKGNVILKKGEYADFGGVDYIAGEYRIEKAVFEAPYFVPDWSRITADCNYFAQDCDGKVYGYMTRPKMIDDGFQWHPATMSEYAVLVGKFEPRLDFATKVWVRPGACNK